MDDDLLIRVLTGRATRTEAEAVRAWRERREANQRRYREVAELLRLTAMAEGTWKASPPPSARSLVEEAERRRAPRRRASPGRARLLWAAAAAIVLLALGTVPLLRSPGGPPAFGAQEFVTGPAEQATVVLNEGSVVRLGGNSRLRVPNAGQDREVVLEGRGFFSIARDESRPFVVRTGSREIRVLGTRFAVDAAGDEVRVAVVEGRVALRADDRERDVELNGGQMASVAAGSSTVVVNLAGAKAPADWAGDFLAFQNTPLRDALVEIGWMYDVAVVVTDSALADRTVTAWFSGWTLDAVVDVVCAVADADCAFSDSTLTVSPRSPDAGDPIP